MQKYIARFRAEYPGMDATQYTCYSWRQEDDNIVPAITESQIAHTIAIQFFRSFNKDADPDRIIVHIETIEKWG